MLNFHTMIQNSSDSNTGMSWKDRLARFLGVGQVDWTLPLSASVAVKDEDKDEGLPCDDLRWLQHRYERQGRLSADLAAYGKAPEMEPHFDDFTAQQLPHCRET